MSNSRCNIHHNVVFLPNKSETAVADYVAMAFSCVSTRDFIHHNLVFLGLTLTKVRCLSFWRYSFPSKGQRDVNELPYSGLFSVVQIL